MDPFRRSGRVLGTSTIVLLALAGVLASGLAYQAVDAGRSHEAVARASLREQATFAATNFAREARDEVLFDLLDEGVEVVESSLSWSGYRDGDVDRFRRVARSDRWPFADETILFFRLGLPGSADSGLPDAGDSFTWGGSTPDRLTDWVRTEVENHARVRPDNRRLQLAFSPDGPEVLTYEVSSQGRGRAAIHGLVLTDEALRLAFLEAFEEESLLPAALTSGLTNDEIFLARVLGPDDRVIYASSDGHATDVVVDYPLDEELGGMRLELGVLDESVEALVAGGVPESRLPFVLSLLALTALLLGTAVWQLRREAELARLRADFVSGVSHQLLTPLTQIRMFGETLLLGRVRSDEERTRAAEIIVDEATRLTHQVENVLTFSRGEAGTRSVDRVETDLTEFLHELLQGYEPLARAEGASIETRIDPELHGTIDPEALRQALLNLLDNALKYGGRGQTLEVGAMRQPQSHQATIWVEDEGPGIPEGDRSRIWNPYERLDHHREGAEGGSGIGLAVVRRAVAALGGEVRVEDSRRNEGTGARFSIDLPLNESLA